MARSATNTEKLIKLRRNLGKFPAELRKELRPVMRKAGAETVRLVKQNSSWSQRIPGATRLSVQFSARFTGVSIVVNRTKAPHALALENQGNPGRIRHPVFGNENVWVYQDARPYAGPAATETFDQVDEEIGKAVDIAARPMGFR